MEKQEAIDFILDQLSTGHRPDEIAAALSRKLNAPVDLVAKFVRKTAQDYERSNAARESSAVASPQPFTGSEQPAASSPPPPDYGQPAAASMPPPAAATQKPCTASPPPSADNPPPDWNLNFRRLDRRKNLSICLGALIVGLFVLIALAAALLAPPDPDSEFSTYKGIGQINQYIPIAPRAGLILGSTPDPKNLRQLDVWYSVVWGTRSALRFGILVVLFTGVFGVILGGVSGYLGGVANTLVMGFTDAFLAVPVIAGVVFFQNYILLLLRGSGALVYWNGSVFIESPTAWQIFLTEVDPLLIAFIVFTWMPYARLMNSVVLHARQEEYILASRSLGAGHLRLIFHHILPNAISPVIVLAARDVGYLVLLQAGFTFIGLTHGSEWGVLLSLGRKFIIGSGGNLFTWWWTYLPTTLAVVLFGVGWHLLGDGLNTLVNPHQS